MSPSSEAATFVSHVPLTSWRAQWLQSPCLQQNAHEITNRVLHTHEGLTQETFGGAEHFACNDLSTLSNAYFDANIGHAVMYVWNMPATSPFHMGGLSRHKGILRPEGLRGGNPGPLDAGGVSSLNILIPGATGPLYKLIIPFLPTTTVKIRYFYL